MKTFLFFTLITLNSSLMAADCPISSGKYGEGAGYQNIACRIFIKDSSRDSDKSRNFTFTDEGQIQVFSNFPGTTNSNSTGARIFYLFPLRTKKNIAAIDESHLSLVHPSGAVINFDKTGKPGSKDLVIKVASEVNSQNKSGVEIESYPQGLVVDLGYRMGNTPVLNKNATVTITDKNKKKCVMVNSEFNKVGKDKAELIYKTNEALHKFLSSKCPQLDISDLLRPLNEDFKAILKPTKIGAAAAKPDSASENDSQRGAKPRYQDMDDLINHLENDSKAKSR